MLPITPISLLIIKVSCIYMHISVSFTFFADTEGTTAYGPTTLCGALAIAHARVYINKVYDHVGGLRGDAPQVAGHQHPNYRRGQHFSGNFFGR